MLEPQKTLHYLAYATRFGGGETVPFGDDVLQWELEPTRLTTGLLDVDTTREILNAYSQRCTDVPFGEKPVPVVACLRWFVPDDGSAALPLLLVSGTLDVGGALHVSAQDCAWIPWGHLACDGSAALHPTVCSLDALRVHQEAMAKLPGEQSWTLAVERAAVLFDAVCTLDTDSTSKGHVDTAPCMLRIWDRPNEQILASRTNGFLARDLSERGEGALARPLRSLLGMSTLQEDGVTNELPEDELLESKLLCGIPDHIPALSAGDRAALLGFAQQRRGDVLVVHAAAGTNAPTVGLAALANHLTESALRGDRAPTMACFASLSTLRILCRTLAQRPAVPQTALPSRWLPRIAEANTRDGRRVLGPLHSVALLRRPVDGAITDLDMPESYVGHPLLGDNLNYCDPWYVPQATTYYLDCVSGFLGERVRDLSQAVELLSQRLRRVDQDRCDLIDAYAQVCHAETLLTERDRMLGAIGALRDDYQNVRKALMRWEDVANNNPPRRGRVGRSDNSQDAVISQNTMAGETIPLGRSTVAEVVDAYRAELGRVESEIERLRRATAELNQRARAANADGQRCAEAIKHLQVSCGLTLQQTQALETTIDGREVSMRRLDSILDRTVRPAEFWLAVHVYEGRWLILAQRDDTLQQAIGFGGAVTWRAEANLYPVSLVSMDTVATVVNDARGKQDGSSQAPIDLAVVLDADELNTATGTMLLGNTSRALILGSEVSLGPQQPQGQTSDEIYGTKALEDDWDETKQASMNLSGSASLFGALLQRQGDDVLHLRDVRASYGEFDDLRCDLCPYEPIRTLRNPSNSADDPTYPLLGIVPALSHVLVPDSAWQQMGASRTNRAEAMALVRWMNKHGRQLCERYDARKGPLIAVLCVHHAQADLLKELLVSIPDMPEGALEICALREARGRMWPVVLASATCGPAAYADDCACNASSILSLIASSAQDAMVLFWGGAWTKSNDPAAQIYLRRATMVGRLYSVVRARNKTQAQAQPKHMGINPQSRLEVDLRAKPLSLTALLAKLEAKGDLPEKPSTSRMNIALEQVGLITRADDGNGHKGWKPTPAGREIGILGTSDKMGNPFCAYGPSTEPVITSTALTLLDG